jgi:2-dehydropantoate 2-reductase
VEPGHVRITNLGASFIGGMLGSLAQQAEAVALTFSDAGIATTAVPNARDLIWGKALVAVTLNAIAAVSGYCPAEVLDNTFARDLARSVVDEIEAVAEKSGVQLPFDDAWDRFEQAARAAGMSRPSMLQDLERGRATEIDFLTGAVARVGAQVGVPTPVCRTLTHLVHMRETRDAALLA